jgi:hypothetical protein
MVTDLLKVAVEGGALLLSMYGVFSGIDIDYESPLVPASKQSIGGPAESFFQSLQPLPGSEDVVLESAECGLPGSAIKLFPQGQSERRVHPQMIGVIAIFIACRYLIDPLAQELKQRMICVARRPRVFDPGRISLQKFASFIYLPHEEEAGVRSDFGTLEVDGN